MCARLCRCARHLTRSPCAQADFLDGDMGSSNMKGFVMSLQKKGMVHHSILVEQVRGTRSENEFHMSGAASNVTLATFAFSLWQHFSSDICGKEAFQFFSQMLTGSIVQFGKK